MKFVTFALLFITWQIRAQNGNTYLDSIQDFRNRYVSDHEVVKGTDQRLMDFFPIDPSFRVNAKFERIDNGNWFQMNTTGKEKKTFRKYGKLIFSIHGKWMSLFVYQSQLLLTDQEYKNYLFIPFTDATNGVESYGSGRFIDCTTGDIHNNSLMLDFNKAYNPYCAYASGYNCPKPPKENDLAEPIRAGEKNFGRAGH